MQHLIVQQYVNNNHFSNLILSGQNYFTVLHFSSLQQPSQEFYSLVLGIYYKGKFEIDLV